MFGLGLTEILLLALIAFLAFGPKQFPIVARNLIKILNELKAAFTDIKTEFYDAETEVKQQFHEITDDVRKNMGFTKDHQKTFDPLLKEPQNQEDKPPFLKDLPETKHSESEKGFQNFKDSPKAKKDERK